MRWKGVDRWQQTDRNEHGPGVAGSGRGIFSSGGSPGSLRLSTVDSLQHELLWYQRRLFGRRSEKLDPDQQMLFDLLEHKIRQQTAGRR